MGLPFKARDVPGRAAAGTFILHSGLGKWKADRATAEALHGMAANTYPFLAKLDPVTFTKVLAGTEIALGTALVAPVVPTALAGLGLSAFSGGLLGLYARTAGMREEGTVWPTQQGLPIAKDVWLLGIGLGFVVQGLGARRSRTTD
ncbi:hypothetical protein ND748_09855 [Frankia sp. AiPs1]|uniref:hypothetical protein n=1 Tax=Frankia sp. AiPs1 TaxID=573493 RepID=UPI002043AAB0|nr:hypothetical protein [Frankia sp. AiPs1]MCM3921962.1 hypothetical protein [Frankia sp. AiPs1]